MDVALLFEEFVPKKLPCRNQQVKTLERELAIFKKNGICSNLLLDGVTGSGKTVTIRYIQREFPDEIIYSNAMDMSGNLLMMLNHISDTPARTRSMALENAVAFLKKNKQILVLDEVHLYANQKDLWDAINSIYRRTATPTFIATNRKGFLETLSLDSRDTLLYKNVLFPSYNAREISKILTQRVRLMQYTFKKKEWVVAGISKMSYEHGARMALNILRTLILEDNSRPLAKDIQAIKVKFCKEDLRHSVMRMVKAEQNMLFLISDLLLEQNGVVTTRTVIDEYTKDYGSISREYASRVITALIEYGYIEGKIGGHGNRAGKTRHITMEDKYLCEIREMRI